MNVKKISLLSVVFLIIASIDNIRNLPAAALFGSSMLFFFILSAAVFLIPTAFAAAKLSALYPDKGGIYHWVDAAFGKKWGMSAIWLQWINTMIWYPTMLAFIAGTLTYLINPELAQNKVYLITCILSIFWGLTFVNLKGMHISALLNNLFAVIGIMIPMLILIVLGLIWVLSGNPCQIQLNRVSDWVPSFSHSGNWIALVAIMASFLGIELSGVHINEMDQPKKKFPKAILIATLFIFVSMVLGSLAIASVVPTDEIQLVSGVMQVFNLFFEAFHLQFLAPILAFMIAVGSIGTMINWLISPAKGLLHAAENKFLPPFFAQKNRAGVPANILLMQGVLVTLLCLIFLLMPSVNAFYWLLTALSTELYMLMYILMFCAYIQLGFKDSKTWLISSLGLFGCITTIIVSFFAPEAVDVGGALHYTFMIGMGNVLAITPLFFFFLYEKRRATL